MSKKKPQQKKNPSDKYSSTKSIHDQMFNRKSTDRLKELAFKNSTIEYLDEARKKHFPKVDSAQVMNNDLFKKKMTIQKSIDSLDVDNESKDLWGRYKNSFKISKLAYQRSWRDPGDISKSVYSKKNKK